MTLFSIFFLRLSHSLIVSLSLSLCSLVLSLSFGTISLSLSLCVVLSLEESSLKHETCIQTHRAQTSPQHMDVFQEDESDEESGIAPASNNGAQSESSHDESSSSLSDDEDHADRAVASSDGGASHAAETESGHQVHEETDEQSMDRESIENSPDQFRDTPAFRKGRSVPVLSLERIT